MRGSDLVRTCMQNLMRRKARTMLTVLGVIVGCCSIVLMISIGIGMKEAQDKMLSELGDLTLIQVYPPVSRGAFAAKLDSSAVEKISNMEQVELASPKLTFQNVTVTIYAGKNKRYESTMSEIVAMKPEAAQKLGYQLLEGSFPAGKTMGILVGQDLAYSFSDTKRPEGHNTVDMWTMQGGKPSEPYFNPMKEELTLEIEVGGKENKKQTYSLKATGRMKEDYGKGFETSQGVVMSLTDMENIMALQLRAAGKTAPRNKTYENVVVKVDDMKHVAEVEAAIEGMGLRSSSMESIRKPMEKEARQKQMMLGGLGAVSLLVAALGITNTMIMSISERTKEIGVMKSLGCHIKDIRFIFLLEAGCIGFLGGAIGIVISLLTAACINVASSPLPADSAAAVLEILTRTGNRVSVVPLPLILFALLFSVVIGVGSGYYPANKAVRISALEAIKRD